MIAYKKKYTLDQFDKELEFFLTIQDPDGSDCECCYDFGYLEVTTDKVAEVQPCLECNYIFHVE